MNCVQHETTMWEIANSDDIFVKKLKKFSSLSSFPQLAVVIMAANVSGQKRSIVKDDEADQPPVKRSRIDDAKSSPLLPTDVLGHIFSFLNLKEGTDLEVSARNSVVMTKAAVVKKVVITSSRETGDYTDFQRLLNHKEKWASHAVP